LAKLLYFAWVRQKIGKSAEELALPEGVTTIGELIDALAKRGPGYAAAFRNPGSVRCAINQEHKAFDTVIKDTDEIAFFPPVTGG
jgi:molybdopterin synthase sulfur carrier subunit